MSINHGLMMELWRDYSGLVLLRRCPFEARDDVALGERDFGTTALDDASDINDNITQRDLHRWK